MCIIYLSTCNHPSLIAPTSTFTDFTPKEWASDITLCDDRDCKIVEYVNREVRSCGKCEKYIKAADHHGAGSSSSTSGNNINRSEHERTLTEGEERGKAGEPGYYGGGYHQGFP